LLRRAEERNIAEMKRYLLAWIGLVVIVAPWVWAFTMGRATAGEAQGSGSFAYYASLITVPLGLVFIAWGIFRGRRSR